MKNLFLLLVASTLFTVQVWADDHGDCSERLSSATDAAAGGLAPMAETTDHINAIMSDADGAPEDGREAVKRFELFRFEKDYHAKNVLHYGMKLNIPSCTIAKKENGAPSFSNYWLMGEERGQTKNMSSDDLKRLGPIVLSQDEHNVTFKMPAFKNVPIRKKEVTVEAKIVDGICKTTSSIELDNGHRVDLTKIYAKMSYFVGIPTGVNYLDVHGIDRTTGEAIKVRFDQ
ncbi:MAG: hypothetical protein A2X86_07000 [Bdellovibrionales bacterium GWA2_49_15]|nr:MAG: hypothetical protein A2X86_07000 [Bdellovibrionales bacterium GWA2_49_15]HAZ11977.1 hypothetical protein [Bdellovibrionales bacterium]